MHLPIEGLKEKMMRNIAKISLFCPLTGVLMKGLISFVSHFLYHLASLEVVKTSSADHYSLYFGYLCWVREQWSAERSARIECVAGLDKEVDI